MITYVIQGDISHEGGHAAILKWARELCAHIKSLDPKNPPRLMTERFGQRNRLYFVQNFDSLEHLEKFQQKLAADSKYKTLMKQRKWTHESLKDKVLTLLD